MPQRSKGHQWACLQNQVHALTMASVLCRHEIDRVVKEERVLLMRSALLPCLSRCRAAPHCVQMLCSREKNWGFTEEDGVLLVTYALLPCTVVLEFNPAQPKDLKIRSRHCYVSDAPAILQNAGWQQHPQAPDLHASALSCHYTQCWPYTMGVPEDPLQTLL